MRSDRSRLSIREIAELAVITALLIGGKEAMNVLPNIHPVTLILILCVRVYGVHALYPAFAFGLAEILLYGPGIWSLPYLYIWPLTVAAALPFRTSDSNLFWAIYAAVCGLLFGLFCSVPYLFLSGPHGAFAYWVAGIGFDLIQCVSNFVLTFFAGPPLYRTLEKLHHRG